MTQSQLQPQLKSSSSSSSSLSSSGRAQDQDQDQDQDRETSNPELRRQHILESMAKLEGNSPIKQISSRPVPTKNTPPNSHYHQLHQHHQQHPHTLPVILLPHQQMAYYHHHPLLHPAPYVHYPQPCPTVPFLQSSSTNRFIPSPSSNPAHIPRPHQFQVNHHRPAIKSVSFASSSPIKPHQSYPSILISPETSPDSSLRTLHSLNHPTPTKVTTTSPTTTPTKINMISNQAQLHHYQQIQTNLASTYHHHPQQTQFDYNSRAQAGRRSMNRRPETRLSSSSSSSSTGNNLVRSTIEDKRLSKPPKVLKFLDVLPSHPSPSPSPAHRHHHHSALSVPSHRTSVASSSSTTASSSSSSFHQHPHQKKLTKKDQFSWFDY